MKRVVVRREVTKVVEETVVVEVDDPSWLDSVAGQDWLDGAVVSEERLVDVVDATSWVAADPSTVPA